MKTKNQDTSAAAKKVGGPGARSANEKLKHHRGSHTRHVWPYAPYLEYSPGVQELLDQHHCYTLVNEIAAFLANFPLSTLQRICSNLSEVQLWRYEVDSDGTAILKVRGRNETAYASYTYFANAEWDFDELDLVVEAIPNSRARRAWQLVLPSETWIEKEATGGSHD